MEFLHAKFFELDVAEPVITYDNIDSVMPVVITLPQPNFDIVGSSTAHGGSTLNENVAEHRVEDVVEPRVENSVDPPVIVEVAQPDEPDEKIHVKRSVRQK